MIFINSNDKCVVISNESRLSYFNVKIIFVAFVCLASTRFMSFQNLPDKFNDILEVLLPIILIGSIIFAPNKINWHNLSFRYNIFIFIFLALTSSFVAAFFHNQQLYLSALINRTTLFWFFYLFLHNYNIPTKNLIVILLTFGIIWCLLNIGQQFTFPTYYFYTRSSEGEENFYRAGIFRFGIDAYYYGLFLIVFSYYKLLRSGKLIFVALVLLGITSLYYTGTRQFLASIFMTISLISITYRGNTKYFVLLMIMIIAYFLYANKELLFGDIITMTKDQISSTDEVRKLASQFFLIDYWPNWLAFIFGNGIEHANSSYGREMATINTIQGFYRGDVGIIGGLNTFGIGYVINILSIFFTIFMTKLDESSIYLKFLFFNIILLILLIESFSTPSAIPFLCIVLYLMDKFNINSKANNYIKKMMSKSISEITT